MNDFFRKLSDIDLTGKVEKNFKGLSYISWSVAYRDVMQVYPDMQFEVICDEKGNPFFEKSNCFFVKTSVTISSITKSMILPVMDSSHYAVGNHDYEMKTKNGIIRVEAIDSRHINDSIMRCLVKNLALFGYGLSLYAGEDIPIKQTLAGKHDEIVEEIMIECLKRDLNQKQEEWVKNKLDSNPSIADLKIVLEKVKGIKLLNAEEIENE
jgi:hypothetical protein